VIGDNNSLTGDVGNDTIWASGNSSSLNALGGNNLVGFGGNDVLVTAGAGNDTTWAFGDHDTLSTDGGNNTTGIVGDNNVIVLGSGSDTVYTGDGAGGAGGDSIDGGGTASIFLGGSNTTFVDSGHGFNDTVVGFDHAKGDSIQTPDDPATVALNSVVVNGTNTLITFGDGSTLLLKWVTNVDSGFFR
jgi:hypothetical protein